MYRHHPSLRRIGLVLVTLVAVLGIAACNPGSPDGTPVGGAPAVGRVAA